MSGGWDDVGIDWAGVVSCRVTDYASEEEARSTLEFHPAGTELAYSVQAGTGPAREARTRGARRSAQELVGRRVERRWPGDARRATGWPWRSCTDRPTPLACIVRLADQVVAGGLAPDDALRRMRVARECALSLAEKLLEAANALSVETGTALHLTRRPHAKAEAREHAVQSMRKRYDVPYAAALSPGRAA